MLLFKTESRVQLLYTGKERSKFISNCPRWPRAACPVIRSIHGGESEKTQAAAWVFSMAIAVVAIDLIAFAVR